MKKKEFWRVEVKYRNWVNSSGEHYVFATSAATAEKKVMALEAGNVNSRAGKPYVTYAEFAGYIEG